MRHKSNFALELQFPVIDDEDWVRALNDVGLLVFAQGFPVLYGQKYEHYALGGARVIRKAPIVGTNIMTSHITAEPAALLQ